MQRHLGHPAFASGMVFDQPDHLRRLLEEAGFSVESIAPFWIRSRLPKEIAIRGLIVSATAGMPTFRQLDVSAREQLLTAIEADAAPIARSFQKDDAIIVPWVTWLAVAVKP